MYKHFIFIAFCLLSINYSFANNLQIGPVTITAANGSQYLNFTIGWSNSWRTSSAPNNWDAVWVFVKRRDCASLQWHHVNLSPQDSSHTADNPLLVDAYTDKKGVMIYRAANGSGSISNVVIKLKLDSLPAAEYDYQVHGIEMVYVPQGSFYLGDASSNFSFLTWPNLTPFYINGEGAITIGQGSGTLFNNGNSYLGMADNTVLDTPYPKGYNAFYCMKYEISQGQYASFLNSITQDAAQIRLLPVPPGSNRYNIGGLWPQLASSTPNRACNFLSFQDLTAYLDWSALSPMTELEYEKVCRGANNSAIVGEMAWGGNVPTSADTVAVGTDGTPNEYMGDTILPGSGLANYIGSTGLIMGPLRCGFAARNNSSRFEAGAAYYGAMEMSGNVTERCYNVLVSADGGGIFTGSHGDGELTSSPKSGYANAGWPQEGFVSRGQEVLAVADRGGSWERGATELRISDRTFAARPGGYANSEIYQGGYGGRGVSRRQQ